MRRPKGIQLLEAILALFLLSVITILVANLLPSSRLSIRKGENRYQAQVLAESALQHRQARSYQQLVPGTVESEAVERNGTTFEVETRIDIVGGESDRLRSLTVIVTWAERTGPSRLVRELRVADLPR